jgi:hypothetical protein
LRTIGTLPRAARADLMMRARVPVRPLESVPHRWLSAAILALQVALASLIPLVEARAEARSDATVHIEARSEEPCAPPHDPSACSFCRVLASKALGLSLAPKSDEPAVVAASGGSRGIGSMRSRLPGWRVQARGPPDAG